MSITSGSSLTSDDIPKDMPQPPRVSATAAAAAKGGARSTCLERGRAYLLELCAGL